MRATYGESATDFFKEGRLGIGPQTDAPRTGTGPFDRDLRSGVTAPLGAPYSHTVTVTPLNPSKSPHHAARSFLGPSPFSPPSPTFVHVLPSLTDYGLV
jgi:hypothetical protein